MTSLQPLRILLVIGLTLGASARTLPANETNDGVGQPIDAQLEQLKTSVYCYCGCTRETIQKCVCLTARQIEDDREYWDECETWRHSSTVYSR